MKKILIALALLIAFSAVTVPSLPRPTPQYVVWYDNGESVVVNAFSLEEALIIFQENYKYKRIFGINQISYVESRWIWLTEESK